MKLFTMLLVMMFSLCLQAKHLKIKVENGGGDIHISMLDYGELFENYTYEDLKSGYEKNIKDLELHKIYVLQLGKMSRYFYTGDGKLNIVIKNDKIELVEPTGINKALDEWYTISDFVRCKSSEFYRNPPVCLDTTIFFREYKDLEIQKNNIINKYRKKLQKEKFEILQTIANCDMDYFLYSYITIPSVYGLFISSPGFIKRIINNPHFDSVNFLNRYPDARLYLLQYVKLAKRLGVDIEHVFKQLKSDDIRAFYAYIKAKEVKTYTEIKRLEIKWGEYFTSKVLRDRFDSISENVRKLSVGEYGFNFALPDLNDKIVKFSDFKGKVVFVDLWATWCGPCRRELSHLKKIKEEFKGEDIVFVYISVDKQDLKEKWRSDAISIGGVQLLDSENTVGAYYKCSSVPRFLIFDKEGKIISLDAKSPSNPRLKTELKNILGIQDI